MRLHATAVCALAVWLAGGCGILLRSDDEEPPPNGAQAEDAGGGGPTEAEAATPPDTAAGDADAAPTGTRKLVFVTKDVTTGRIAADASLGVIAADQRCEEEARDAGSDGAFVAWLHDFGLHADAVQQLPAADAYWARPDGTIVFPSKQHLVDGRPPLAPIADASVAVWTGVRASIARGSICSPGWSSISGQAIAGDPSLADGGWTERAVRACNANARLLCFER